MAGNSGKGMVVQERDRSLLRELGVMRVIDREHAKIVARFRSTTRANVRLLALTRHGLLRRFFSGTTAGGKKALYALSTKGAALVGVERRGPRRRTDEALVADFFVEHQMAINEIYCTVKYGALPKGATFHRWIAFHQPLTSGLRLIPDGYFEQETPSETVAAFLEVDLGHESLKVWKEKVRNYLQFALSGDCKEWFGQTRFRVLVVAHSDRRMLSIRKAVAESTEKIFWLSSFESINRDGFFSPVWLRPKGEERLPLIPPTRR